MRLFLLSLRLLSKPSVHIAYLCGETFGDSASILASASSFESKLKGLGRLDRYRAGNWAVMIS